MSCRRCCRRKASPQCVRWHGALTCPSWCRCYRTRYTDRAARLCGHACALLDPHFAGTRDRMSHNDTESCLCGCVGDFSICHHETKSSHTSYTFFLCPSVHLQSSAQISKHNFPFIVSQYFNISLYLRIRHWLSSMINVCCYLL